MASFKFDGFIFDEGPHVSFTKHEYLQKLFAQSVDEKYELIQATPRDVWKGRRIKHPAICNFMVCPPTGVMNSGGFHRGPK